MKMAWNNIISNCFFIIVSCFFYLTLFISCGLETYVVVDAPTDVLHPVTYQNELEKTENYFYFRTNENGEYPNDFKFLGTDVYYKIYNNSTSLDIEVNSLNSLANSETSSAKAADRLITTTASGGYGYKALKASGYHDSPLIKASPTQTNQLVYIRLTKFQDLAENTSKITKDGVFIGIPRRNISEEYTFDFGRSGKLDKIPLSGDEDVKFGTATEEGKWYVALFAVASGRDSTFTTYYSNILYLGSVTIDSEDEDN